MTSATVATHHRTAQVTSWEFAELRPPLTPNANRAEVARDVQTPARPHAPSFNDVRELVEAAGPLTLIDLAGGLDIPVHEASRLVARMTESDCLRQDEWERYRLWGACRDAA